MPDFPMVIINQTLPLVVKLSPNPNSISIGRAKVFSQTQTLGGWVFEHWGERPQTLRVQGRTKAFLGPSGAMGLLQKAGGPAGTSQLSVEVALFALQQVYALDKRALTSITNRLTAPRTQKKIKDATIEPSALKELTTTRIYYKFEIYSGFFTSFSYRQEAESMPRHYEYEFEFLVTRTAQSAASNNLLGSSFGGSALTAAGIIQSLLAARSTVKSILPI